MGSWGLSLVVAVSCHQRAPSEQLWGTDRAGEWGEETQGTQRATGLARRQQASWLPVSLEKSHG